MLARPTAARRRLHSIWAASIARLGLTLGFGGRPGETEAARIVAESHARRTVRHAGTSRPGSTAGRADRSARLSGRGSLQMTGNTARFRPRLEKQPDGPNGGEDPGRKTRGGSSETEA